MFYLHHNGHSVFAKKESFFKAQGGLTEPWGKNWVRVEASTIEEARELWPKTPVKGRGPIWDDGPMQEYKP